MATITIPDVEVNAVCARCRSALGSTSGRDCGGARQIVVLPCDECIDNAVADALEASVEALEKAKESKESTK